MIDVISSAPRVNKEYSRKVFQAVRDGKLEGFITTQSIIDSRYILSREAGFSSKVFEKVMLHLMSFLNVIHIDYLTIRDALKAGSKDFEDEAQFIQADSEGIDIIVTSDQQFLARQGSDGPMLLTPEGLLNKMS